MQRIKVLLADDHTVVRDGLRAILSTDREMEIVGEAGDGAAAVEMAKRLRPDVAIIDISMPGMDGLEATRLITGSVPFTRVLILSSFCTDDYVQRAIEAGALGYLAKHAAGADLLCAIREVDSGNAFFSSSAVKRLLELCRETFQSLRRETQLVAEASWAVQVHARKPRGHARNGTHISHKRAARQQEHTASTAVLA